MGNPPSTPRSTRRLAVYGVNPPAPREKFAALNAPAVLETLLDLPDQFAEKSTR